MTPQEAYQLGLWRAALDRTQEDFSVMSNDEIPYEDKTILMAKIRADLSKLGVGLDAIVKHTTGTY